MFPTKQPLEPIDYTNSCCCFSPRIIINIYLLHYDDQIMMVLCHFAQLEVKERSEKKQRKTNKFLWKLIALREICGLVVGG